MLENIDDVNWSELQHAYGSCEALPKIIWMLADPDQGVRLHALSYISENLFHQETHYDVNEFALPFLLEVAASPQLPDRVPLYQLLQRMLGEDSIPMSPRQSKEYLAYQRKVYPEKFERRDEDESDNDSDDCSSERYWKSQFEKSAAAAWKRRALLVDVVRSAQPADMRCEAVRLLAEMGRSILGQAWIKPKDVAKLVTMFRSRATADRDTAVRASCALALGLLRDEPTAAAAVATVFAKAKAAPVRTAAAASWCLMRATVPAEALRALLEGILDETLRRADERRISSPLAVGYAKFGLALGNDSPSTSPPAVAVPFPKLSLWLDASVRNPAGLAKAADKLFATAEPPRKMRLLALLGRLHLPVPALDEFLRSVMSNRRELPAIKIRAAAALEERRAGVAPKRFETLLRAGLRSADPTVRRSVVEAVAEIPTFLTNDGFERVNDHDQTAVKDWDAFGYRLLPLVVEELGDERDSQVRLAFAGYVNRFENRWGKQKDGMLEAAALLASWPDEPLIVAAALRAMSFAAPGYGVSDDAPNLLPFYDRLLQYFHGAPEHRARAASLLLKLHARHADVFPLLLPLLETDPDDNLRKGISFALYGNSLDGRTIFPPEPIDEIMLRVLRADRSPEVLRNASWWFKSRLSVPRLLDTIFHLFESDARSADGGSLRPYLVEVLAYARSEYPRLLNALVGTALDPTSTIRHSALDGLLIRRSNTEIPAEVADEAMTRLLESGDPWVILRCLKRHLQYIGREVRTKRMPELAQHPDPLIAQHAKEILERGW